LRIDLPFSSEDLINKVKHAEAEIERIEAAIAALDSA
jgi:hypothetical protein